MQSADSAQSKYVFHFSQHTFSACFCVYLSSSWILSVVFFDAVVVLFLSLLYIKYI